MSQQEIVLVEGSRVFESWKTPPPPVYMEFFFFNVTNVNECLQGAKPVVTQIGPYTYRYDAQCISAHKGAQFATKDVSHAFSEPSLTSRVM